MRLFTLFIVGLIALGCKSSNDDFDPFDKDFKFHNKMNVAECDTIWDTCGYWTFEHDNKNGLKTFYGFLLEDVVGKGFSLDVDRINSTECDSLFYRKDFDNIMKELFMQNPIDIEKIRPRLLGLGVINIKIVSDTLVPYKIEITNSENKIFTAWLRGDCDWQGQVIRHIDFTNLKDELTNE
ncbi:MAG: hypothetical protein KA713_01390 [Chryseotalea sp. WA131a]|jgi:hypothetical protein|nr:MAG: hypothetical protein KA713_01160 [Chryseotalea sp. WA131a]UXE67288.1 MAG: hypothetical protein KA713_01390 [Chryseotalea sp. WA131a]